MSDDEDTGLKPELDISTLPPKQAAYALLRENGLNTDDAAKALDYKRGSAYQLNAKLNKFNLVNKKIGKAAHQVVENILNGKTWGAVDKIKDSTTLAAAQMFYDRAFPIVRQSMNLNINADISPVDLSAYLNKDKKL